MHLPTTGQHFPFWPTLLYHTHSVSELFAVFPCIYFCFTLASFQVAYSWGFSCKYDCSVILNSKEMNVLFFFFLLIFLFFAFSVKNGQKGSLNEGEPLATWATDFLTAAVWQTCRLVALRRGVFCYTPQWQHAEFLLGFGAVSCKFGNTFFSFFTYRGAHRKH